MNLQETADGMIDRFGTRDTPLGAMVAVVAMAAAGRKIVWNTSREPHLGQRSFVSATTGRTYARKRSDQITAKNPCKEGVVHICAKIGTDSGRRFGSLICNGHARPPR